MQQEYMQAHTHLHTHTPRCQYLDAYSKKACLCQFQCLIELKNRSSHPVGEPLDGNILQKDQQTLMYP